LHNKYLLGNTLSHVQVKPTNTLFWKGIMRVKEDFFQHGSFVVGDNMKLDLRRIPGPLSISISIS
jgi:hypothetical protein